MMKMMKGEGDINKMMKKMGGKMPKGFWKNVPFFKTKSSKHKF
jgi:hypothetical protein